MKHLPSEWQTLSLGAFIERLDAGVSVNAEDTPVDDNEIGVLKVSCVSKGRFLPQENKRVLADEIQRVKLSVRKDTIIISRSNTVSLVGESAYVDRDYPNLYHSDKLWQTKFRQDIQFCPRWLSQVFISASFRKRLGALATGTSGSMKNISKEALLALDVLTPSYDEQRAIADILSCWDSAIETTEDLINAQIQSKRGLMQQLLTGKRRFSNHQGVNWTWLTLGEVANESRIRNNGSLDSNALMAVTKAQGMLPMRERVQGESVGRCKVVSKDWFAYNPMRLNIGSIAKWDGDRDVLVSPDYVVFKCDETKLDPDFLNHFRRTRQWSNFVERSGDGSVRVRIYFSHLASLKMHLPPFDEQRRIAQFLNACDKEIALLKQQLDALKRQKRGLMQKLLTGQLRVKVDDAEAAAVEAG